GAGGGYPEGDAGRDPPADEDPRGDQHRAGPGHNHRPETAGREGGPDPDGGRVSRVLASLGDDGADGAGAPAARQDGSRRVPAGGHGSADKAGPQDEPEAGAQGDGDPPTAARQDAGRAAVAACDHLREGGEMSRGPQTQVSLRTTVREAGDGRHGLAR